MHVCKPVDVNQLTQAVADLSHAAMETTAGRPATDGRTRT
jgi:hypothetical protein